MEKGVFVGGKREREREREREIERAISGRERKRENTEREELREEEEVEKEVTEEEKEEEAITSFVEGACAPTLRTFGSSTSTTAAPEHRGVKARVAMRSRPSSRE